MLLETERLCLREFREEDAESIYALNADPEVIQFTGDGPFENPAQARAFLEGYDHYRRHGFGRWAVIRRADGAFLGWCGLKYTPELDEYDLGFRFFKHCWNRGYATEAASACLQLGFERFGLPAIVGRARRENLASIRVLEKIGLTFVGPLDFDGMEGVIYRKDKPV
jgi:RimJ/RimL family protein N-acetyltransferase